MLILDDDKEQERQKFQLSLNEQLNEILNSKIVRPSNGSAESERQLEEKPDGRPVRLRFTVNNSGVKKFTISVLCQFDGNQLIYIPGSVRDDDTP